MQTQTSDLAPIFEALPDLSRADRLLIERAYERAREAHEGQFRNSGEPYIRHCLAVAQILADMKLDATSIAAALLHDVVEDTGVTLEDIEQEFGEKIAELVAGVTKMKQLPTGVEGMYAKAGDREMEYLRKMLLAMASDFRVMVIKLADRLHNMRTLGYMSPEKQQLTARETLDIFAPIANRLGIWQIKWQLEDLSFRYLNPEAYRAIREQLNERRADREKDMERTIAYIREQFAREGLHAVEIKGRPKHIYSIYRKMERKTLPFNQIHDIRAIRIIVETLPECYQALGIIHNIFHTMPGEFDDYISSPKENHYRSLHTGVRDREGKPLEIQIRTREMDEEAEYGIAAHWRYKEGRQSTAADAAFERRVEKMRRWMEEVQQDTDENDAGDFVTRMVEEISPERIYVFTPKGDIVDLPEGATPIDFAYHIHTEIGHRCRGAKVNGRLVSLDYQLKNTDQVEILTANRGGPSLDWLNTDLGYTKTSRARNKIKQYFRRRDREKSIADGKEILDRELRKLGMATRSREEVAQQLGYAHAEDLMAAIGYGEITGATISLRLLESEQPSDAGPALEATVSRLNEPVRAEGMRIDQTDGLLVTLARCCNPTYGDEITGFITRGKGITVHRADCKNVLNTNEPERLIHVTWPPEGEQSYPVPVLIVAYDREGLMRDIGAVIADENINMSNVNISTRQNIATFELTMEIRDIKQLARILAKIERLPNVVEAIRRTAI